MLTFESRQNALSSWPNCSIGDLRCFDNVDRPRGPVLSTILRVAGAGEALPSFLPDKCGSPPKIQLPPPFSVFSGELQRWVSGKWRNAVGDTYEQTVGEGAERLLPAGELYDREAKSMH